MTGEELNSTGMTNDKHNCFLFLPHPPSLLLLLHFLLKSVSTILFLFFPIHSPSSQPSQLIRHWQLQWYQCKAERRNKFRFLEADKLCNGIGKDNLFDAQARWRLNHPELKLKGEHYRRAIQGRARGTQRSSRANREDILCRNFRNGFLGRKSRTIPKRKEQECTKRNTTITLPHLSRGLKHTWPIWSVYSVALLNSIKIKSGKALLYIYSTVYSTVYVGWFTTVALANLKRKSNSWENSGVAVAHWGWHTCLASIWHKPCLLTRRGGFVKERSHHAENFGASKVFVENGKNICENFTFEIF